MQAATKRRPERVRALAVLSLLLLFSCGPVSLTIADKNDAGSSPGGEDGCGDDDCAHTGGVPAATGGAAGSAVGGSVSGGENAGGTASRGGSGGSPAGGSSGAIAMGGGTGGVVVVGGSAGSGIGGRGGTGGDTAGGAAGSGPIGGAGGAGVIGPYDPRSGPFKMLVSSQVFGGFAHDSRTAGKLMLQQIAEEKNFEVKFTENTEDITPEGLAQYEVVFFLNTAGDLFSSTARMVFEDWITTKNGGFVGVHSAADTAQSWVFYKELTGQYHDLHYSPREAVIEWDPTALTHPAVRGLPSPWTRTEEWFRFSQVAMWSAKPGFLILSWVTVAEETHPVSFVREWGNFRSFYTSLGHADATFQDANVKKHVTAGIMWAARRDHLLE